METNLDKIRAYYASFDEWGRLDAPEGAREFTRAREILVDPDTGLRAAADTGAFSNPTTSGFQEGYYPLPNELAQLFVAAGFAIEDMLSLKSIANDRAHQVARLEPGVRDEVERLARALCRQPEIIATCGHALLVARKSP